MKTSRSHQLHQRKCGRSSRSSITVRYSATLGVEGLEGLARGGVDVERDAVVRLLALDDECGNGEVAEPGVRRRTDHALRDLGAGDLSDGYDVAGTRWRGDERLEAGQVDLFVDVVRAIGVGGQLDPVVLATFGCEEAVEPDRRTGKTVVVAPSSAPMFAITCRSIAERPASPGPWYSMIRPSPPFTS